MKPVVRQDIKTAIDILDQIEEKSVHHSATVLMNCGNYIAHLEQQRDELLSILDELTDVFANIGMTAGIYDDEQDVLRRACDLIYRMKGN